MSIKTFFERVEDDLKSVFGKLFSATWEQKVLIGLTQLDPFIEGVIAVVDPSIAPLVIGILNKVTDWLTEVKSLVAMGTVAPGSSEATQVTSALNSVKSNLAALLADSDIKNSTKVSEITAVVNMVDSEANVILANVPAAPAAA
jgi:hypothetical protein